MESWIWRDVIPSLKFLSIKAEMFEDQARHISAV